MKKFFMYLVLILFISYLIYDKATEPQPISSEDGYGIIKNIETINIVTYKLWVTANHPYGGRIFEMIIYNAQTKKKKKETVYYTIDTYKDGKKKFTNVRK
mgnify:CR=1 FL=1